MTSALAWNMNDTPLHEGWQKAFQEARAAGSITAYKEHEYFWLPLSFIPKE